MNTSFKKISEKLLDVRIFNIPCAFQLDGGQGDGEMGGGTCESEDFLSLIFLLEHYGAYEKSDFTENLDERDGQWKFLIPHKIYSELSLSRTASG